ncbi:MAG: hypothetical protein AB7G06_04315 [Bdellovibrionales bacterium]
MDINETQAILDQCVEPGTKKRLGHTAIRINDAVYGTLAVIGTANVGAALLTLATLSTAGAAAAVLGVGYLGYRLLLNRNTANRIRELSEENLRSVCENAARPTFSRQQKARFFLPGTIERVARTELVRRKTSHQLRKRDRL